MNTVMDISSYWNEGTEVETTPTEEPNRADDYQLSLALQSLPAKTSQVGKMPADLATLDAELFLQRIYTYQR